MIPKLLSNQAKVYLIHVQMFKSLTQQINSIENDILKAQQYIDNNINVDIHQSSIDEIYKPVLQSVKYKLESTDAYYKEQFSKLDGDLNIKIISKTGETNFMILDFELLEYLTNYYNKNNS